MSITPHLPYPPNCDQNLDEDVHEERCAAAVRLIDAGAVIAEVELRVAEIADPKAHPLFGVVQY